MADVKIIDIDGTQWDIKDQEARNSLITLKTKTVVKVTKKIDEKTFKMNLVEINDEKFLQLHIAGYLWDGAIGDVIATFNNDFGIQDVIRMIVGLDFSDYTGRGSAGLDIEKNGTIRIYPYTPNMTTGMFKRCFVYGDAFLRITY